MASQVPYLQAFLEFVKRERASTYVMLTESKITVQTGTIVVVPPTKHFAVLLTRQREASLLDRATATVGMKVAVVEPE